MTRTLTLSMLSLLVTGSLMAASASGTQPVDLTSQFRAAGVTIRDFRALELGGVVLLRGHAVDHATAEDAGRTAQSLGYTRVANLVQVVARVDDEAIERQAERELAIQRSLDGCSFHVDSKNGVVRVAGEVRNELQKDMAIEVLRSIDGVREVHAELQRR